MRAVVGVDKDKWLFEVEVGDVVGEEVEVLYVVEEGEEEEEG